MVKGNASSVMVDQCDYCLFSLQKKMFSPFGPQFSLNIMGGPRHPGAPPPLDPLLTKHVGEYRKLVLLYYMFTEICLFTKLNLKK